MSRISEYTPVTSGSSAASGDIMVLVDVSDTSGGTAGTTKNATISHLASTFFTLGLGAGISALPTMGATGIAYAVGISGSTPYKVPRADLVFDKEELFISAAAEGTLTDTDAGDYFIVYDDSGTAGHKVKKIASSFLDKTIEDFFDEAALAGSLTASMTTTAGSVSESDWYIIYDASTSTVKKILKSDTVNLSLAIAALSTSPPTPIISTDYIPVYSTTGLAYQTAVADVFNTGYSTIYKGLTTSAHPIMVNPIAGTTAVARSWITAGGTNGSATKNERVTITSLTGSIELVPTGTGAVFAEASSSLTAGTKRGAYAVDLQLYKASGTHIAQGDFSALLGGINNSASGTYSAVVGGSGGLAGNTGAIALGGFNNSASGAYSAVVGGGTSHATADYSVIVGAGGSTIRGINSAIAGGFDNVVLAPFSAIIGGVAHLINASADYSVILGGDTNQTDGDNTAVIGGANNLASGLDSVVVGGSGNLAGNTGAIVLGGINNSVYGAGSVIIGGEVNTIDAAAINSVVIGGTGQTVTRENTAHAVNLHANATFSMGTTAEVTGTATRNDMVCSSPVVTRQATVGAMTVSGITGGWDGRQITFLQHTGAGGTLVLLHNSALSATGNRLWNSAGADANVTITGTGSTQYVYSSAAGVWMQTFQNL